MALSHVIINRMISLCIVPFLFFISVSSCDSQKNIDKQSINFYSFTVQTVVLWDYNIKKVKNIQTYKICKTYQRN
jgi:hypothetical protein